MQKKSYFKSRVFIFKVVLILINHKKYFFNPIYLIIMKNFKPAFFSFILSVLVFTSCTNNEPITLDDVAQTVESLSVTQTMNRLSDNFNQDGSLNSDENPNGNILFDFCFEFVYPLDLSYNNGTVVTVNSFEDLIDVIVNSTDDLFVNGISFPFQVEQFNSDTDSIETITINNEDEFVALLDSCDFDDEGDFCTEEYNPVCVEISYNGETITVTFPNACYAEYEGFTSEDFIDCEDDNYNGPLDDQCFSFNFPISIITHDGETVTANNQDELDIALYTSYGFDFVYPFDVTLESDETVVTINTPEDFNTILDNCYDDEGNLCDCLTEFDPVCVETLSPSGGIVITVYDNACIAECEGFTAADFVDCENIGGESLITDCISFQYPIDLIDFSTGDIITVNSDEEMNTTYNPSTNELVLPFNILSGGAVVTVNTPNDLFELLAQCD